MASAQALQGRWRPEGASAQLPFTEIEIRADGKLRFLVKQPGTEDSQLLDYRIENGWILTRAAGEQTEERTGFSLQPDGSLVLEYGGHPGRYLRAG
ncbi:MAG: hypothetical protein M3Y59_17390 [Myxococcota bacterium]|nr:hypothetical protein [Myxococcota bacterium]